MKRALIFGVTGMDGSHLADLLVSKLYEVHGVVRRASTINTSRIDHLHDLPNFKLHYGEICDNSSATRILSQVEPHEVYNLAAQSHVKVSFDVPISTADSTAIGALKLLEAVREVGLQSCRVYQASSSEMFGQAPAPQRETTPFHPRSPYGCAKVFAYHAAVNYREAYGMHISNGILFNHTGPRRGETFVCRKITRAVGRILTGAQQKLVLGNLDAERDWGWAPEYVEAMWLMLQQDKPDDYVIGTGTSHSVRHFVKKAFEVANLDWHRYVEIDEQRYARPAEVDSLRADPMKARRVLGWKPSVTFDEIVWLMVKADIDLAKLTGA